MKVEHPPIAHASPGGTTSPGPSRDTPPQGAPSTHLKAAGFQIVDTHLLLVRLEESVMVPVCLLLLQAAAGIPTQALRVPQRGFCGALGNPGVCACRGGALGKIVARAPTCQPTVLG